MQTLRIRYLPLSDLFPHNSYDCLGIDTNIDECEQQLMELQELYNSQQLLTAELSDKLEKTEVKR